MHAYIISALRKDMPSVFGKEGKKKELIKNLDALYSSLQRVSDCITRDEDPTLFSTDPDPDLLEKYSGIGSDLKS